MMMQWRKLERFHNEDIDFSELNNWYDDVEVEEIEEL